MYSEQHSPERLRQELFEARKYIKRLEERIDADVEIPLRDRFAGQALSAMGDLSMKDGFLSDNQHVIDYSAEVAYAYADAMLKARKS